MNPARLSTWALIVVAALGNALALGSAYWLGFAFAEARGDAALAVERAAHAAAITQASEAASARLKAEVERGNRLSRQLVAQQATHAEEKRTLLKRIADVTTVYVPAPGRAPEPLPRTVFTVGFLCEYNAALGLPLIDACAAAGGAGGAADAGPAAEARLRESGLAQADLLAHAADYGERCRNLEAQVNGLLDYLEAGVDLVDRASAYEQAERDIALARHRARVGRGPSASHCRRCDEPIPRARQIAIPGVVLCVDCLTEQEHRERTRA